MSGRGICFEWTNTGRCRFGARCKFAHNGSGGGGGPRGGGNNKKFAAAGQGGGGDGGGSGQRRGGGGGVCHQWQSTGTCRYGNTCKYKHIGYGGGGGGGSNGPGTSRSAVRTNHRSNQADLERFVKHLGAVPKDRIGEQLRKSADIWRKCWLNHAALGNKSIRSMLEVLAKVPGSSSIAPPPVDLIEAVSKKFMSKEASQNKGDDAVLTVVKTIRDMITRCLQFEWTATRSEVTDALSNVIQESLKFLNSAKKEHRVLLSELVDILDDMEKPWRIRIVDGVDASSEAEDMSSIQKPFEELAYYDWKVATVKWLGTPEHFAPSKCPNMKVGSVGVYDSCEDYMNTVHRLWIAMTFFDGHAALAPHCRSRNASGLSCGSALWPIPESRAGTAAKYRCRSKHCRNPVEYCCRIQSHDSLCGECAARSMENHRGGPGQHASTHVYDCQVARVDTDGHMYMKNFKSRNAPPKIHWRTTKRLSPPNLVGIVRLRSKGMQLKDSDRVIWAEIIYHPGQSRFEDKRREKGELAVNLSSIIEFDPDFFEEGAHVAVIDCMCFVPEWVPVLRALTALREGRLPFENGKHLNLLRDHPITSAFSILDFSTTIQDVVASPANQLIQNLVEKSQLEPIREIRRDEALKQHLVTGLEALVTSTTLDPMQLCAFVDALCNPVHLTQGPPGTGKSYFGVVLVRALMVIRDLWQKKSRTAAVSPILVLSYKNHAIDEFLVDITNAEPRLNGSNMIRIGGQCKDARLAKFSEKSAYHSDPEVKLVRARVDRLNNLHNSIQAIVERDIVSFLAYKEQMFSGDDVRAMRSVSIEATKRLMECIIRESLIQRAFTPPDKDDNSSNESSISSSESQHDEDASDKTETVTDALASFGFLELDDRDEPSRSIQRGLGMADGSHLIRELVKGRAHYGKDHWGELILQWLSNKRPRPVCSFEDCAYLSLSPEVPFCDSHACHYTTAKGDRCFNKCAADGVNFCSGHCCSQDMCYRSKVVDDQDYCCIHACKRCITLGKRAMPAVELPPRNVCEDHPLCLFLSCLEPCLENSNYCVQHDVVKCQALTKKRRPCQGKPISRNLPFCFDHKHLAKSLNIESLDDDENATVPKAQQEKASLVRCSERGLNGNRCKNVCLAGSTYCYEHMPVIKSNKKPLASTRNFATCDTSIADQARLNNATGNGAAATVSNTKARSNNESCQEGFAEEVAKQDSTKDPPAMADDDGSTASNEVEKVDGGDPDEFEVGENLQHLRDVFEIADDDDFEDDSLEGCLTAGELSGDASDELSFKTSREPFDSLMSDPNNWTWDMSLDDRWRACQAFMDELRTKMDKAAALARKGVVAGRKDFQQAIIRAKAKAYENKTIIGGTMVGCISRLDSIAKTRPFAVVCEEASEVLEPLLFSCLSESTLKLEMVGDHRQLQPSVMDRYEFELCNKVNVSLFQRLIEAPKSHTVPSTVLSIQRRMRTNIADLTRDFYTDITTIQDHESCGLQVIGQRTGGSSSSKVALTETKGREVPGVKPHVFLWTHSGTQQRASVGVSRMNSHEALMACNLAAYLVECGVPRSSIAILTPYKGQLMAIRKLLTTDPRLRSMKLLSKDPLDRDTIRISTVDRFQGDEEDIVICSLTVDAHSKTGFVKLVNRMIVLLSRPRLALYVLSNAGYFESNGVPSHWAKTFELFKQAAKNDNTAKTNDDKLQETFQGERSGPALPLCCPVHREVVTEVKDPASLKLGFCSHRCKATLNCGHACSLLCHWASNDKHNQKCTVKLESPCHRHPEQIDCHDAFKGAAGRAPIGTNYNSIMEHYRCTRKVETTLQCGHTVLLPCFEEKDILAGNLPEPVCKKQSPISYTFRSCGHQLDVTCSELVQYRENPTLVRCEVEVNYEASCGHTHRLKCWKQPNDSRTFVCEKKVKVSLPRCGHEHTIPCRVSQSLHQWNGVSCSQVGVLIEGTSYGPQDYPCSVGGVQICRPCGHNETMQCSEAFARIGSLQPCRHLVESRHPSCGHTCQLPCLVKGDLEKQGLLQAPDLIEEFREGEMMPSRSNVSGVPLCNHLVKFTRACGHVEKVKCCDVQKPCASCQVPGTMKSPLCGHDIDAPCFVISELRQIKIWNDGIISEIIESGGIARDASVVCDRSVLSSGARRALASCSKELRHFLECGHEQHVGCKSLVEILLGRGKTIVCERDDVVQLPCGHSCPVKCEEARRYEAGSLQIKCREKRGQKCWNFLKCGNLLEVECDFKGTVACCKKSTWICQSGQHQFEINQCSAEKIPIDCPECSLSTMLSSLSDPPPFEGKQELSRLFATVGQQNIAWIEEEKSLEKYLALEKSLFEQHRESLQHEKDSWGLPIFGPKRVACFRKLSESRNRNASSFDPKKFVRKEKSWHGLVTRRLTKQNLERMLSSDESVTLLVGYATAVKTKVLPTSFVTKDKKSVNKLVRSLTSEEYDTLSFVDKSGLETLVSYAPFPLLALCRLTLKPDELLKLANSCESLSSNDLAPSALHSTKISPGHVAIRTIWQQELESDSASEGDSDEGSESGSSSHAGDDEMSSLRLKGTLLEGFLVQCNWDGGFHTEDGLPSGIEKDLAKKMQISNKDAEPFAGIHMLRSLLKEENTLNKALLHLLLAVEILPHAREEAQAEFAKYLELLRAAQPLTRLHPWSLLLAARLDESISDNLLGLYSDLFPTHVKYMSKEELDTLRGLTDLNKATAAAKTTAEKLWEEWSDLKEKYPNEVVSDATEELLSLVGVQKVKKEVLTLWKTALQLRKMDVETRKQNLPTANYIFVGNPGSGKTTVARLFSIILSESGIREKDTFVETTAQQAKDGGTDEFRKLVTQAMGGTLFIDEAPDIDPKGDFKGKPIMNELLTLCENERDKISVVLAGYEDDMAEKIFSYNDGIRSRFRQITFDDFDESELKTIWTSMREKRGWNEQDEVASVAARRLARASNRKGFGNARAVRQLLESATKSAMARLGDEFSMQTMDLEIEDVIGEDPRLSNEKLKAVWNEIKEKIGWQRVKDKVEELIQLCGVNYKRELRGQPALDVFLNRMFLGNPGTGKTTCAKLYGRLLKQLGFLSNGDVVVKTASDFIGGHVGQSQAKAVEILEGARGKVLVIDECYALDDALYGKQVLGTLVEKVQGGPTDDIAVLLLGYETEMSRMINDSNPGLARRFPLEHAFYFDDYDEKQLLDILNFVLEKQKVNVTLDFRLKALDILKKQRRQPNFGNAGAVELLVKGAIQRASKDRAEESDLKLDADDIEDAGSTRAKKDDDPLSQLDKLYRMEKVKDKLERMQRSLVVAKRDGDEDPEIGHFVFLGSPGTGKTTVARALSDILFSLGLKSSNILVETSALELTGDAVGQTKTKVQKALKDAASGILFIDEAYNLGEGPYGKEACDTLVAAMTDEEYRSVLIVIAGYATEINDMLNANAGLKSRFKNFFEFPDWDPSDCAEFFRSLAEQASFTVDTGALDALRDGCRRLKQLKGWGNGRDLMTLWSKSKENRAQRVYGTREMEKKIVTTDIQDSVKSMLQARIGKLSDSTANPFDQLDRLFRMQEIKKKIKKLKATWTVAQREGDGTPDVGHFVFTGPPGTGKTTVARCLATVLFGLELKPSDKIVETTAQDLTGDYVGQTKTKVHKQLDEAKGGFLFCDEAYGLGEGPYGKEAIDTLVAAMTSPDYKDVQIVIAGYPAEIDDMFRTNPGFKSRFQHFFEFQSWSPEDCALFFSQCAANESFEPLEASVLDEIKKACKELILRDGWANGRDIKSLFDMAKSNRAERICISDKDVKKSNPANLRRKLLKEDVMPAILSMLEARRPKSRMVESPSSRIMRQHHDAPIRFANDSGVPPDRPSVIHHTNETTHDTAASAMDVAIEKEKREDVDTQDAEKDEPSLGSNDAAASNRDDGVPDDVWEELQACIAREVEQQKELERLEAEAERVKKEAEEARRRHEEELARIQQALEEEKEARLQKEAEEREARRRHEEEVARIQKELEEEEKARARKEAEEREARRRHAAELAQRQKQLEEEEKARARKEAEEREARRRAAEEARLRKIEERRRRMEEERRKKEAIIEKLRVIGPCPAGYDWHKVGSGWRCGGGSHYVSNKQLHEQFGMSL